MNAEAAGRYVLNAGGCWVWGGYLNPGGYGTVRHSGRICLAHRAFYETHIGPIPKGLTLDHLCHTNSDCPGGPTCQHRRCVNPQHLEPVTHRENILRGRAYAAGNAAKTHCKHGHELSSDNLYYFTNASGRQSRKCRACAITTAREWRNRQMLAAANVSAVLS